MKATIAALLVVAGLSAQAAEPATLTLACEGTTWTNLDDAKQPISRGIIINFTARTVAGFLDPGLDDFPVAIRTTTEVTVVFGGSNKKFGDSITGSIDRVTGDAEATFTLGNITRRYSLKCKPTQRMF
jgi:hypothetical protein